MKHTKKVMALVLSLTMVLAMGTLSAFAASVEIDTDATDTHTYKVYQIFTGDLSEDGNTLSNLKYGTNYVPAGKEVGGKVPKAESDAITDAAAFSKDLIQNRKLTGSAVATLNASNNFKADDLADGYYLIVDETAELAEGDALSANIVQVVGTTKIAPKKDLPSGDKSITTDTLGMDSPANTVNGKVDNVSIGDTVNFEITGTIPSHATDYDYYYFIIGDTLSEGLTFGGANTISVKVDGNALATDKYAVYTGADADGKTFQVALKDAKSLAGKTVVVTYSATLNEKAKIGEDANTNTMSIEYSNNPNSVYDGTQDKDKPGKPDKDEVVPTGETPEVTTETYTTALQIKKVDENGNVLTGAEFTITGDSVQIVLVTEEKFTAAEDGEYYKLNDGTYTKDEPITENYMKRAEAGANAGYVVDGDYTGDDKVVIGGITYRPYKDGDEGDVYVLVEANADQYESTTTTYKKTVEYTQKNTTTGTEAKGEVDENGLVTFKGLGEGTYTITESKTPNGYNTIDPIEVKIEFAEAPEEGVAHWSSDSQKVSYDESTGTFKITIENQQGSELPETGGIGTMIFYVLGTLLVVGCGIVLVSKRRMENK